MIELESSSAEETERIAAALAASSSRVMSSRSAASSGRARRRSSAAPAGALGVSAPVTSPTFTIGHRYAGRVPRLPSRPLPVRERAEEEWGDLEPYFDDAVVFVEWPEAAGGMPAGPSARVAPPSPRGRP